MKCAETTVIEKPVKTPARKKQVSQAQQGQVPEVKQSAVAAAGHRPALRDEEGVAAAAGQRPALRGKLAAGAGQKPAVQEAQEAQTNKDVITLPMGLLGFEQV